MLGVCGGPPFLAYCALHPLWPSVQNIKITLPLLPSSCAGMVGPHKTPTPTGMEP